MKPFAGLLYLPVAYCFTISQPDIRYIVSRLHAETDRRTFLASAVVSAASGSSTAPSNDTPTVTHRAFFDIRVSRQDVFTTRLEIELFGQEAPNHVQRFLEYLTPKYDENDNPFPNYGRSTFTSYEDATGLIQAGAIPSLNPSDFRGSPVLSYGSRIIPASLWLDQPKRLSHNQAGLLTHRDLEILPKFGITCFPNPVLDRTHTVFGRIVRARDTIDYLTALPRYSITRDTMDDSVLEKGASTIYNAQRDFFRGAASNLGDTRVAKVYPGKFLRRVETTQCGIL